MWTQIFVKKNNTSTEGFVMHVTPGQFESMRRVLGDNKTILEVHYGIPKEDLDAFLHQSRVRHRGRKG